MERYQEMVRGIRRRSHLSKVSGRGRGVLRECGFTRGVVFRNEGWTGAPRQLGPVH